MGQTDEIGGNERKPTEAYRQRLAATYAVVKVYPGDPSPPVLAATDDGDVGRTAREAAEHERIEATQRAVQTAMARRSRCRSVLIQASTRGAIRAISLWPRTSSN
jgi:hypothetical protein